MPVVLVHRRRPRRDCLWNVSHDLLRSRLNGGSQRSRARRRAVATAQEVDAGRCTQGANEQQRRAWATFLV
eukprot:CAMPEP_0185527216 /NCGR_PEP_ID=MMETSP1366-20130426/95445_1 /TAXON_ID=38817 /ORGANISM="Gephyrocapsa oceanica, Strain RCC1303" /LENGTH=70 /DNA_ID=CAMNT_0028138701 /DNA_START=206 /DNA_END=415 /DNA_ORIENTATION=+